MGDIDEETQLHFIDLPDSFLIHLFKLKLHFHLLAHKDVAEDQETCRKQDGGHQEPRPQTVTCGSWSIEVQLDPDAPEHLLVRNTATGSVYSYGYDNPVLGGNEYSRRYNLSSILYDRSGSEFFISEMTDQSPISTRSRTF